MYSKSSQKRNYKCVQAIRPRTSYAFDTASALNATYMRPIDASQEMRRRRRREEEDDEDEKEEKNEGEGKDRRAVRCVIAKIATYSHPIDSRKQPLYLEVHHTPSCPKRKKRKRKKERKREINTENTTPLGAQQSKAKQAGK